MLWAGLVWDEMGWDAMERGGMGWDGVEWKGMGWDGMGWDGMGWEGMGCMVIIGHRSSKSTFGANKKNYFSYICYGSFVLHFWIYSFDIV